MATVFNSFLDLPFWAKLLVCWCISPGAMIIIAPIFEGRFLPLGKGQWRSFMPGDPILGIGAAGVFHAAALNGVRSTDGPRILVLSLAVATVISIILTLIEARGYTRRAIWSPTKIYHNLALYIVYGALISWATVTSLSAGKDWLLYHWVGLIGVATWFVNMTIEAIWLKSHPKALKLRHEWSHIDDWRPFRDPRSYHHPQQ